VSGTQRKTTQNKRTETMDDFDDVTCEEFFDDEKYYRSVPDAEFEQSVPFSYQVSLFFE
jgi:hypothetical protein